MFTFGKETTITEMAPGVTRKVLSWSEELMLCEITFEKGAVGKNHAHPHLQVSYVVDGSFSFTIDGETKTIQQGDSVYMPSNAEHSLVALTHGVLIDVFNPKRDDFL